MSSGEERPDRLEQPDTTTLASCEEASGATVAAGPVFLPSEVLADRFRVVRLLGCGGMGEVYEVEDLELGERVAVKTLRPGLAVGDRALALFRSEIQLARRVTHPNVCRIFDVFRHTRTVDGHAESVVFLTMELLAGDTLSSRLRRDGPLPLAAALPLLRQIAAGLDAAHEAGVAHRDFKSGNVMLVDSGRGPRAVVTDFGLAGAEEVAGAALSTFGTAPYRAPEQARGGPAGVAADLYSFGVVAREVLTGSAAPGGAPLPEAAAQTIARCLDERPEARPSSAGSAYGAIASAAVQGGRSGRLAAALLGAVLAGGALFAWRAAVTPPEDGAGVRPRFAATEPQGPAAEAPPAGVASPRHRTVAVVGDDTAAWQTGALAALLDAELVATAVEVLPPGEYARLGHGEAGRRGDWRPGLAAMGVDSVVDVTARSGRLVAAWTPPDGPSVEFAAPRLAAVAERLGERLRGWAGGGERPPLELRRAMVGDDALALGLYARALNGEGEESLRLLERALERQPQAFRFHLDRGALLYARDRLAEAAEAGREARRLAAGLDEDRRLHADLLLAKASGQRALEADLLDRLIARHPERRHYALQRADVAIGSGALDEAERVLDALRSRQRAIVGDPLYQRTMVALWQTADASGERLAAAEHAAALFRRFGLPAREFDALFHQHEALRRLRRFEEDAAVLDRAEQLADQLGSLQSAGQVQRWRGVAAMVQGDAPGARAAFERALALAERSGDAGNLTWSLNNLAILRMWQGELAAAGELYERARRSWRDSGAMQLGAVIIDGNRAELLVYQGRLDEASALARRVLAEARRLDNAQLQVHNLDRLARVALERGDPEGAQALLAEALALSDDESFRMVLYPTLARVELSRGDLERARSWALRSLTAGVDDRSLDERLLALHALGEVEEQRGRRGVARRHLDEALALTRRSAMELFGAGLRRALGRLERRQGNLEAAERLVLRALADHRRFGAELEAAHDLLELAELQLATGAGAAGEGSARQALAVYERLGAWGGAGAVAELLRRAPSASRPPPASTVADAEPGRPPW